MTFIWLFILENLKEVIKLSDFCGPFKLRSANPDFFQLPLFLEEKMYSLKSVWFNFIPRLRRKDVILLSNGRTFTYMLRVMAIVRSRWVGAFNSTQIPVTALSYNDLFLDGISLEWDSRRSAMTNHKKTKWSHGTKLSFFHKRKGILKIYQSGRMPWHGTCVFLLIGSCYCQMWV